MNSRRQRGVSEDLDRRADKSKGEFGDRADAESVIKRFVESLPWWLSYGMGAIGIVFIGIQALVMPERKTLYIMALVGTGLAWILMSGFWARLAKSSLKSRINMLTEYEHLFAYMVEMNTIVKNSLESLAAYDRERAVELAHDLDALATKSVYDSYWRGDPRETEKGEVDGD